MIHLTITVQDFNGRPRILFRAHEVQGTTDRAQRLARTLRIFIVPFLRFVAEDHELTFRESR